MQNEKDITLQKIANEARGLAIDAITARASGHLGLPLGCAEIGAVLFSQYLNVSSAKSDWLNRDRFILSAGHGSMFLYSWLHLLGFDLSLNDLANFRVMGSKTPGHPEFGETDGVEATSGPLGQGIANAVGMAISAKMAASRFNTAEHEIFNHKVWCLAGDGCIQEGISSEASALAATLKLDNLVLIYDSNDITLDTEMSKTSIEDTFARYKAYGFDVMQADGHNFEEIRKAFDWAKNSKEAKPKLIIFKTLIGKGIAEVEGKSSAHGEGGVKFAKTAKESLGLDSSKNFQVSEESYDYFKNVISNAKQRYVQWEQTFDAWKTANPDLSAELDFCMNKKGSNAQEIVKMLEAYPAGHKTATRNSGGQVLNKIAKNLPYIVSGSADLFGSTKNYLSDLGDFSSENGTGRNIWFGIREHAMGAITNGIAYYGLFTPSCATFLTFAGYMFGAIRISALAKLNVQYIFTHDSVGVGFDGPTHQPVELVSMLRSIPHLQVIRPADADECVGAWALALSSKGTPSALILSRQDLPLLECIDFMDKRNGVLKGAYIVKKETSALSKIIIATGSEVQHAVNVAMNDDSVRVVSMPCMEAFEEQTQEYKDEVLPKTCTNVIAIEAGVSGMWYKYANKVIGTDDFGFSADTDELFDHFGINEKSLM